MSEQKEKNIPVDNTVELKRWFEKATGIRSLPAEIGIMGWFRRNSAKRRGETQRTSDIAITSSGDRAFTSVAIRTQRAQNILIRMNRLFELLKLPRTEI